MAPQAASGAPARTDLPHAEPPSSAARSVPASALFPAPPTADVADSAATMPSLSSDLPASRPTDIDIAVPVMPSAAPQAAGPVAQGPPAANPLPALSERARPPSAPLLRTTGLATDDERARAMVTLRGHGGDRTPVTSRSPTSPPDARPEPKAPPPPDAPPELRPRDAAPVAPTIIRPRASTSEARPASRLALLLEDEARVTAARAAAKLRVRDQARVPDDAYLIDEATIPGETTIPGYAPPLREAHADDDPRTVPDPDPDPGVTEPSLSLLAVGDAVRVDLPLPRGPARGPAAGPADDSKAGWASGLAARIDAALDSDEWNLQTPIVPPTKAELRALLGRPDPTRQQPVDEIALLQRHALEVDEPELLPRRAPHPTTEVDPDDIESVIEIAPPVRRPPNAKAIGVAKPKKSE